MEVVIKVDSKNVCIETLARRRYWSAVNLCMIKLQQSFEDIRLVKEIEILKKFLEETNMEELRSQIDYYLGGEKPHR